MLRAGTCGAEQRRLAQVQENDKPVLVYSTFPSAEAAEDVGRALVEGKLAACVNIVPGMVSVYRWEGRIERGAEVMMIIKTRTSLAQRVVAEVRTRHAYENPALLVLPVIGGSDDFLAWIMAGTQGAET
jgi:periplasmic divalent cation tolerance protein